MSFGIEALNCYCGLAYITVKDLFEARGLNLQRLGNLMMERRSIALPCEDPVTNAVNAAAPIVEALSEEEKRRIEIVITATESGIDYSKSIASYVHEHLGLSRNCRFVETKQACFAATAAVQMAVGFLASNASPGAKVLIIATDIALVDGKAEYAEPAMGTGAAAILVSDRPEVLTFDLGAFGIYCYETMDSARPTPEFDIVDVDGSLFSYLDCLSNSFGDYRRRVEGADFGDTFHYLALHTPFSGLVKAAHRKMMREETSAPPETIDQDFERRVIPSLTYPSQVGNLCSGSVYLALASTLDHADLSQPARVGLFSYGSGCSSEFFSGLADATSAVAVGRMEIGKQLENRYRLTFGEYSRLLKDNLRCLVPAAEKHVPFERFEGVVEAVPERRRMLFLRGVENYHRKYEWI